jgi:tRNA dimethylallyltransferase
VIALVGATATGKTALGIEVARQIGGEIISVDSRQVYRGMDIGTAKATLAQQAAVPHHGLDLVEPNQRFSAGEFARRARGWIVEITARGRTPLLVGGTGFFLRALTHPIFQEPPLGAGQRAALERWLAAQPTDLLVRWLAHLDPESAGVLATGGGRQRLVRALTLPLLTGRTLPWWQRNSPPEAPPLRPQLFVLELPPERLRDAIDDRVTRMAEEGLGDEVRGLVAKGYHREDPGMNATGYIEMLPWVRGECDLDAALDHIRRNTRAYARRQRTWFRHQLPPGAERLDATQPVAEMAARVVQRWEETKRT